MSKRKSRNIMPGDIPMRFTAFFDGCCEPVNPGGTAGYGVIIFDRQQKSKTVEDFFPMLGARVYEHSGILPAGPTTSNNVAEYLAIQEVMEWLIDLRHNDESAQVFGDSRLVIAQLWGWPPGSRRWKINGVDTRDKPKGFYADVAVKARETLKCLPCLRGFWIPREHNMIADELSKLEPKVSERLVPYGDFK